MKKFIRKEMPEGSLVPLILLGASDARFMRNLGAEAYGFSLFEPDTPASHLGDLVHWANERVSEKTLDLTQKVHYHPAIDFLL